MTVSKCLWGLGPNLFSVVPLVAITLVTVIFNRVQHELSNEPQCWHSKLTFGLLLVFTHSSISACALVKMAGYIGSLRYLPRSAHNSIAMQMWHYVFLHYRWTISTHHLGCWCSLHMCRGLPIHNKWINTDNRRFLASKCLTFFFFFTFICPLLFFVTFWQCRLLGWSRVRSKVVVQCDLFSWTLYKVCLIAILQAW